MFANNIARVTPVTLHPDRAAGRPSCRSAVRPEIISAPRTAPAGVDSYPRGGPGRGMVIATILADPALHPSGRNPTMWSLTCSVVTITDGLMCQRKSAKGSTRSKPPGSQVPP
jgi:hypothetical protein